MNEINKKNSTKVKKNLCGIIYILDYFTKMEINSNKIYNDNLQY